MAIFFYNKLPFEQRQLDAIRAVAPALEIHTDIERCPVERIDTVCGFRLPAGLLPRFPALRWVASCGAGADGVLVGDLPAHVRVTRGVDPLQAERLAQYAVYHVLRAARQMPLFEAQQRRGEWHRPAPSNEADWTVGIMGLGQIGLKLAEVLIQLGYPVRGWSRSRHAHPGIACYAGDAELDDFLAGTRVLVLLLPATPATAGLVDARVFASLPAGAHLIQMARGSVLVEADLLAALDSGHLAQAVLDVFAREPLPADSPLWTHPRMVLTPHIAGETRPE